MAAPRLDDELTNYLTTTDTYLNTGNGGVLNYVRLGLVVSERNKWHSYAVTQWPELYNKSNDPNFRTPNIIAEKDELKLEIIEFINPLLFRMAGSSQVTLADKNTLLLPAVKRTRKPRLPIETAPNTSMSPMEGGTILVSNRVDKSEKRDKMHPDADALEMVFKIGGTPPTTPLECSGNFMSSKAKFIFQGGMENDGKKLFAYTRWVNLTDPSKTGPWSTLVMATISAGTPKVVEM
jgi:hypothetical protein